MAKSSISRILSGRCFAFVGQYLHPKEALQLPVCRLWFLKHKYLPNICIHFQVSLSARRAVYLTSPLMSVSFQDQRLKEISMQTPPSASPSSQSVGSANNNNHHISQTPELFGSALNANRCANPPSETRLCGRILGLSGWPRYFSKGCAATLSRWCSCGVGFSSQLGLFQWNNQDQDSALVKRCISKN